MATRSSTYKRFNSATGEWDTHYFKTRVQDIIDIEKLFRINGDVQGVNVYTEFYREVAFEDDVLFIGTRPTFNGVGLATLNDIGGGYEPDEETITLNSNDKLEATNVSIWRYE